MQGNWSTAMNTRILLLSIAVLALSGCLHSNTVQTTFDPAYPERNDAGDSIVAVFEGRIPCVDQACEMRKVELVLYGRDAGRVPTTYWLGQVGMGGHPLVQQGAWSTRRGLQEYPDGMVYQLDSGADPSLRNFWRVNNEIVLVLDQNMRPKAGDAAWGFMLSRDCTPYGPRTYPYDQRLKRFVPTALVSSCAPSSPK
jgi:hypothetical protein